jgi:hypothetical protein
MDIRKICGANVRRFRLAAGISQEAVATAAIAVQAIEAQPAFGQI